MTSGGGTAKTILCVEDEPRLRQDIADEISIAGYTALAAADGQEALVLLDARRPDLADVPLVFLTALGGRDHVINGKRAGADEYLVKPIDFDLMLATRLSRL